MKTRNALTIVILVLVLILALTAAIAIGAVPVAPISLLRLIAHGLGVRSVPLPGPSDMSIILLLRLPRVVVASLVGSGLAVCGVVMQGLLRNPMASPEVLGVSAGASLGAVISIITGLIGRTLFALPLLTISGALLSAGLIYILSSTRGTTSLLFIVISGMAMSYLFGGVTSGLLLFSREHDVSQYIFWTMGGLEGRTWQHVLFSAPVLAPGAVVLGFFSRELNVFSLGEESASSLGMNVETTKRLLLVLCAVLTGVAISVAGPIGFIGLLVPHLFRLIIGPDHRVLIPVSALGGAIFLIVCDLIGRAVAPPFEIRAGIITAIIGSPYLLYLIIRSRRKGAGRL